jgi:hypothetical protein
MRLSRTRQSDLRRATDARHILLIAIGRGVFLPCPDAITVLIRRRFSARLILALAGASIISALVAFAVVANALTLLDAAWSPGPVAIFIDASISADQTSAIRRSISDWNAVGARVQLVESSDPFAPIEVHYAPGPFFQCGHIDTGAQPIACAYSNPGNAFTYPPTGQQVIKLISCSIEIDGVYRFGFAGEHDRFDFYTVFTHELGHCLGLGHSSDTQLPDSNPLRHSVMYYQTAESEIRRITADDSAGLIARYPAPRSTPVISSIPDLTIPGNSSPVSIPFTVSDLEVPADQLSLSYASGNLAVIPGAALAFGGSGTNRSLIVSPPSGVTGSAAITISVTNGAQATTTTFMLTIGSTLPAACTGGVPSLSSPGDGSNLTAGQSMTF